MLLIPSPISCLLLYYRWRSTLFQEVPLGLPLLAIGFLQFRRRPYTHQLHSMFFDQWHRCRPCWWPRNATQRTQTYSTARVAPVLKALPVVCRDHCMVEVIQRLAPFQLEVAAISHPRYLYLVIPPPPSPYIPPELLTLNARRAGMIYSILTRHIRGAQLQLRTSEKPAQVVCSRTPPHFLSTRPGHKEYQKSPARKHCTYWWNRIARSPAILKFRMGSPRPTRYGPLPRCFGLCGSSCHREGNGKRTRLLRWRRRKCPAKLAMREHLLIAYAMNVTARHADKRVILGVTASAIIDAQKRRVLGGTDEKWRIVR